MKKVSTLLLFLCMALVGYAQVVHTVGFDDKDIESEQGWFTYAGGHTFNTKYVATYQGKTYAKPLKLESSSSITFTTQTKSTVVLVQSITTNGGNYFGFDDKNLTASDRVDDATNKVGVYTIENVAPGKHTITRGTGETGMVFIRVTEEASTTIRLAVPVITADDATGEVTIGTVENASSIVYTTDGSTPAANNGTAYTAPFTVGDGTTVKAIALGDGTKYANSEVSTLTVLLSTVPLEAPTFTQYNGTVMLTEVSSGSTLEYSLDGATYVPYVVPFTLDADGTVYARAKRNGKTSEMVTIDVKAVAKPANATTVILSGTTMSGNTNSVTFSNAPGYKLAITGNTDKPYNKQLTIKINAQDYSGIKLSNGAQNTLTLPAGKVAKRITLYSIINATSGVAGWKEVGGVSYESGDGDYKQIPMANYNSVTNNPAAPDVRIYAVDGNQVTFTNAGEQVCFVIAVDVVDATETLTTAASGYATYAANYDADYAASGLTAYAVKYDAATNKIAYNPITGAVPANTAVLVKGTPATNYTIARATTTASPVDTDLKAADGTLTADGTHYGFATVDGLSGFYRITSGDVLPAKKGYLVIATANAKSFYGLDTTTGIQGVEADAHAADAARYNIAGQRVSANYKGIVIQNGRKIINK